MRGAESTLDARPRALGGRESRQRPAPPGRDSPLASPSPAPAQPRGLRDACGSSVLVRNR